MDVTKRKKDTEEKKEIPLNLPSSCLACRTLGVATFPVYLTEHSGKTSIVCYVARCVNCGFIKRYGMYPGIFKMPLAKPDFHIERWPEILRNGIDPLAFEEAILNAKKGPIYLDARNGLKEPPIPEEWDKRLRALLSGRGSYKTFGGFNA